VRDLIDEKEPARQPSLGEWLARRLPADRQDRMALWPLAACVVVAGALRLWQLDLRPIHHDEGVVGWFLMELTKKGTWTYNPENYHGPFLYYLGALVFSLFGMSDTTLRLAPALFGTAMPALLWPLRRRLGPAGVGVAGALIAVSPCLSYFSRQAGFELYLVFFTLAAAAFGVAHLDERRPPLLMLAVGSLALAFAVKETAIVAAAAFGLAVALAVAFGREGRGGLGARFAAAGRAAARSWRESRGLWMTAGLVFLAILVLFYSAFGENLGASFDLVKAFTVWGKRGVQGAGHEKPLPYYLRLMLRYELGLLALGIVGWVAAVRRRDAGSLFLAGWAAGMFVLYTALAYKTPWLTMNILTPLAVLGGLGAQAWLARPEGGMRLALGTAVGLALLLGALQARALNFARYDDDRHGYVYVQTFRQTRDAVADIEKEARRFGQGAEIKILARDYWPLPWLLRDLPGAVFHGQMVPEPDAPVIVAGVDQEFELKARLKGVYVSTEFPLRPGVRLRLYVQRRRPVGFINLGETPPR
jgi:uncharacterized protein (TIGR03663 family)